MKRSFLAALLALACAASQAAAQSNQSALSDASTNLSGVVIGGSMLSVAASGRVLVASVTTVGDGLELVLESTLDASRATVRVSRRALGNMSLVAGLTLEVLSASTGQLLVMSGKAIAFLPNEAGRALLHHAREI